MKKTVGQILTIVALAAMLVACGREAERHASAEDDAQPTLATSPGERVALKRVRLADPDMGREHFINKGCVICHSVNGVGGKAAPPLDAPVGSPAVDPLEFAARMWRGAPAMVELQSVELGYTISLSADEIADLAAFTAEREAQKKLTLENVPESIRAGFLDEQFWEMEDWTDFLSEGREGYEPPDGVEIEELPVDHD